MYRSRISFLSVVAAATLNRADYEDYLESVYALTNFSKLSDQDLYSLYDNLTFYYEDNPAFTSGQREQSINYGERRRHSSVDAERSWRLC
jgi:hypothetical protein